jgi:hypothetical protein
VLFVFVIMLLNAGAESKKGRSYTVQLVGVPLLIAFLGLTAYFVQRMFSVSMVLPQTPGEVFSDAFTSQKLQEQIDHGRIGDDNLPVYVSSVAYGRILMFSFTSTASLVESTPRWAMIRGELAN